jgi:D-tyrosyl-tRNA(Tyr) deacylase
VSVHGQVVGAIDRPGLLALVGVTHDDTTDQAAVIARKIAELRILRDDASALTASAPVLVVSTRKGRRPSWSAAAPGPVAEPLVDDVVARLRDLGLEVATGRFGAEMQIDMTADGPVTVLVESEATPS